MIDVAALRAVEFPWADRDGVAYLNNASTGPLPARTVRSMNDFTKLRAEPHRISDALQFGSIERTRQLCAQLIGASESEIALLTNTSYGINLAARALPLRAGDTVLSFDREFPANVYPWLALEKAAGVTLRQLPSIDGLPDEEALHRALDEVPRVRAVTVSWVSFSTGYRVDLRRLGEACRQRGIYLVVDAIQGVGALELDLSRCHVDVLACGAQKWLLSPWGTAFVYVRSGLLRELEPQAVGWMSVQGSSDFTRLLDYNLRYHDDARRFEVITLPFQDFVGMNASLDLLFEIGPAAVAAHVVRLTTRIVDWATDRDGVRLVTPADHARRAGIVALTMADAAAASARLSAANVPHSLREGAIRLAPHFYNTEAEVDRALTALEQG